MRRLPRGRGQAVVFEQGGSCAAIRPSRVVLFRLKRHDIRLLVRTRPVFTKASFVPPAISTLHGTTLGIFWMNDRDAGWSARYFLSGMILGLAARPRKSCLVQHQKASQVGTSVPAYTWPCPGHGSSSLQCRTEPLPFCQRVRIVSDECWEAQPSRQYRELKRPYRSVQIGGRGQYLRDPRGQDVHAVYRYTELLLIFPSLNSSGWARG